MSRFTPLACPACFGNLGFRQTVERFARKRVGVCPQCGSHGEFKIDRRGLEKAVGEFFVGGSYIAESYAPVYQVGSSNPNPAIFDSTLSPDAALASQLADQVILVPRRFKWN